jgi:type VI secretion system secreted protein VgrG
MALTQATRTAQVTSPLGRDVLVLQRMTGFEEISRPFEYELELLSENQELSLPALLGQPVTVALELSSGRHRHFNGIVAACSQVGTESERYAAYRATLRPWLWLLTRTADCRIFQEMTVPDIIKQVFRDRGFTDFEEALTGDYRTWEYCVQYRETDFNFVSRLMEQEGIYYYFTHEDGRHQLVLADAYSCHDPVPGYESIPYYPPGSEDGRHTEHIDDWGVTQEVQPGVYALKDFDFKRPSTGLLTSSSVSREHAHASFEVYDYPGEYVERSNGEAYARLRLEELQARHEEARGGGSVRALGAGVLFRLTDYPRDSQNREYLVLSVSHHLQAEEFESQGAGGRADYSCEFSAIEARQPFRAPRLTPKPVVQGPQTATVVGKAGEEIWTDEYGRVKVKFHWDRSDEQNENASCWIRVAQVWAGKRWGGINIPRIGQEVIVEFLEGDPDRPIITGRVYNGEQMPPYGLPAAAVISGMKSDSTKGGGGYNEYVLDDTKGNELIREHGQYDKDSTIEHDLREHVLNDRSRDVTRDETVAVGRDQVSTVGQDQSLEVGRDQDFSIGQNQTGTIGKDQLLDVGKDQKFSIGDNQSGTVGKDQSLEVGANQSEKIGADKSVSVAKNETVDVGKNLSITAGDQVVIKTGSASITMKKDGTIVIKGKDITINGSGAINVKASKNVVVKGQKVLEN